MTTEKKKKKPSPKFAEMYGVKATQIYQGDPGPDKLKIPPPDHRYHDPSSPSTFDEKKVKQIDADGECSNTVEVTTDPDNGVLWVLDGRETVLNIREVNRRRSESGREPVTMRIAPLALKEKEAIAHISIRNFHRRLPSLSTYALNIDTQRKAGWPWDKICEFLFVESDDPEQWCRKRLPLAFCEPEVRAVFDSGELKLARAAAYGGSAPDGSKALGRKQQLAQLDEELQAQCERKERAVDTPKPVSPKRRALARAALTNGASEHLKAADKLVAQAVAATLARVDGDVDALSAWPHVAEIVEAAMVKPKKEEDQEQS